MRLLICVVLFVFGHFVMAQYKTVPQSNTFRISTKKQVIAVFPKRKKGKIQDLLTLKITLFRLNIKIRMPLLSSLQ